MTKLIAIEKFTESENTEDTSCKILSSFETRSLGIMKCLWYH